MVHAPDYVTRAEQLLRKMLVGFLQLKQHCVPVDQLKIWHHGKYSIKHAQNPFQPTDAC
jgi:hypothetical protein